MADEHASIDDNLVLTLQLPGLRDEIEIRHFGFAVEFQIALANQGAAKASADVESAIQGGPQIVKFDELETAAAGEAARNIEVLPEAPNNWHLVALLGMDADYRVLHRKELTEEAFEAVSAELEAQGYEMAGSENLGSSPSVVFRKRA